MTSTDSAPREKPREDDKHSRPPHALPPAAPRPRIARTLNEIMPRLKTLEERIGAIAKAIPGRITFSTSLGIEDQAVTHAIATQETKIDIFTLDTGRHFPETLDTLFETRRPLRPQDPRHVPGRQGSRKPRRRRRHLRLSLLGRVPQGLLRHPQGAPLEPRARGRRRLDHGAAPRTVSGPRASCLLPYAMPSRTSSSSTRSPTGRSSKLKPTSRPTTYRSIRCTPTAFPPSAASPARAPSSRAKTSAPDAGGGRTRTARNADCTAQGRGGPRGHHDKGQDKG